MRRRWSALHDWVDHHPVLLFGLFSALYGASVVARARLKPLWHDEVVTLIVATFADVWPPWWAATRGLDLAPPLNTWVTAAVGSIAGHGPVAVRVAPAIGVWVGCLAIFLIVRPRTSTAMALTGAALLMYSGAYRFAYEARGYGLALGLFALACWAWSEAAAGRQRTRALILLALAFTGSVWAHYYAILGVVPLAAGELVRTWRARRVDRPILGALAASAALIAPLWPIVQAGRAQSATFWARESAPAVSDVYAFLTRGWEAPPVSWLAMILVAAGVVRLIRRTRPATSLPAHEVVAAAVCLCLPAIALAAGVASTGAFVARYALFAIAAMTACLVVAAGRWTPGLRTAHLFTAVVLLSVFAQTTWPAVASSAPPAAPLAERPRLMDALAARRDVVIAGRLPYLQFWHYASVDERRHLVYLADPEVARALTGQDTVDRGYVALARVAPLRVEAAAAFLALHRDFLLYDYGEGWLIRHLESRGAILTEQAREAGARLLQVTLPAGGFSGS